MGADDSYSYPTATSSAAATTTTANPYLPPGLTPFNPQAAETADPTPSTSSPTPYNPYQPESTTSSTPTAHATIFPDGPEGDGGWGNMAGGAHAGVIMAAIIGLFLIIALSIWYCCGGRAWWVKHHHGQHPHSDNTNSLPLYTVPNGRTQPGVHRPAEGGDAPPMYAEVAPPQHTSVAGGIRDASEARSVEEESAVVSDGKTPLSEIPFEDVVLERHVSESESSGSSSRGFESRHHGMGGDTTGHTNT